MSVMSDEEYRQAVARGSIDPNKVSLADVKIDRSRNVSIAPNDWRDPGYFCDECGGSADKGFRIVVTHNGIGIPWFACSMRHGLQTVEDFLVEMGS
jgi:hypothetical protein